MMGFMTFGGGGGGSGCLVMDLWIMFSDELEIIDNRERRDASCYCVYTPTCCA